MTLPLTVHRIILRYQNARSAFESEFTPERMRTLVVHHRESPFPVIPPNMPIDNRHRPGELNGLDGVAERAGEMRESPDNQAVVSWHGEQDAWNAPDFGDFRITEIEVEYDSLHGRRYRTVLHPDTWDYIVLRRVGNPDREYRVPDGTNGYRVRRAGDLLRERDEEERFIRHEEVTLAGANSTAMVVGKHRRDCTWYGLE